MSLEDLRLTNLQEEPNVEEVLRYCSEPFAPDALQSRQLTLRGAPLGKEAVKEISRVSKEPCAVYEPTRRV